MSNGRRNNQVAWTLFLLLLVVNGALYGANLYLRQYNPAEWQAVSDDDRKILLAHQYPDRLESESVGFSEIQQVVLTGTPTMLDPRRAEVHVDTMDGRHMRIHYGSMDMHDYAKELAHRLERPLVVNNYAAELKARDNPLAADPAAAGADAPPPLPGGR